MEYEVYRNRFYGLHMAPGVAQYDEPGKESVRVLLNEQALKMMDPTLQGTPFFIHHVPKAEAKEAEAQLAGIVVRSFYNSADGKHWCELMCNDAAAEKFRGGWKLSNGYKPTKFGPRGKWHGLDYDSEITNGVYTQMAAVPDPRYAESVVLTPEEFKAYNAEKELQNKTLLNSKGEKRMALKFWKKTPVENSDDMESGSVTLKSGREVTIAQLINEAETAEDKKVEPPKDKEVPAEKKNEEPAESKKEEKADAVMCNMEHSVKINDETMTVNSLVEKYNALVAEKAEASKKSDEEKKNAEPAESKKEEKGDAKVEEKGEGEKQNSFFKMLKNTQPMKLEETQSVDLPEDKIARGLSRYGKK